MAMIRSTAGTGEPNINVITASNRASNHLRDYRENIDGLSQSLAKTFNVYYSYLDFESSIRDELLSNISIYLEDHLKLTKRMITEMKSFAAYYDIAFDKFLEGFDIILEDASTCARQAGRLAESYVSLVNVQTQLSRRAIDRQKAASKEIDVFRSEEISAANKANYVTVASSSTCVVLSVCTVIFNNIHPYIINPLVILTSGSLCYYAITSVMKEKKSKLMIMDKKLVELGREDKMLEEVIGPITKFIKNASISIGEVSVNFRIIYETVRSLKSQASDPRKFEIELEHHFAEMQMPLKGLCWQIQGFVGIIPIIEERLGKIVRENSRRLNSTQEHMSTMV